MLITVWKKPLEPSIHRDTRIIYRFWCFLLDLWPAIVHIHWYLPMREEGIVVGSKRTQETQNFIRWQSLTWILIEAIPNARIDGVYLTHSCPNRSNQALIQFRSQKFSKRPVTHQPQTPLTNPQLVSSSISLNLGAYESRNRQRRYSAKWMN